jgi:hypothetical protein
MEIEKAAGPEIPPTSGHRFVPRCEKAVFSYHAAVHGIKPIEPNGGGCIDHMLALKRFKQDVHAVYDIAVTHALAAR